MLNGKRKMPRDVVVVRDGPLADYIVQVVMFLSSGSEEVEIVGRGRNIHRAVAVFNAVRERLSGALKVNSVEIGSESRGKRKVPYIKIRVTQRI